MCPLNRLSQDNRETPDTSNPNTPDDVKADRVAMRRDELDPQSLKRGRAMTAKLAKSHYENFLVASVLLPRHVRQGFYDIYAFCRTADDLADESPTPQVATERLVELGRHLDETFQGSPPTDPMVALANTAIRFDLPKQPLVDLLDAFRQDQFKTRYENFDQLIDYCRRSANPVGRLVLGLGECVNDETTALSDQICTGLQLANFWQDVARDFEIDRLYLPADRMTAMGVTETDVSQGIANRSTPAPLKRLLSEQCDVAEQFLRNGLPLVDQVPRWLAGDVKLFVHGGLATLDAIRRIDFDVLRKRPKVTKATQMGLVARAWLGRL
ncbi:All-trans-phytoene synthase [Rubripirellula tenax]|uniref:All-trans-phytoene synthase n=1 Tax=Rubripirellula tenax TaxID=2528015 RepID=A0A5C6FDD0_9BACT|nr:squalene synthase HpnC [Rubripirellula tenax]TWU59478.1 All-trans-phytoene synthase [Rubripirellula tenax]